MLTLMFTGKLLLDRITFTQKKKAKNISNEGMCVFKVSRAPTSIALAHVKGASSRRAC